jgi:tetratricopeptide (TPR) repeat protein
MGVSQSAFAGENSRDCPPKPKDEETAKRLAGTWFSSGEKFVEAQREQEALEAFNCSLKMVEHPATLFNAGQAARLVKKNTQALKLLKRYLEIAPQGQMSGKARKLARELENLQEEQQQQGLETPPITTSPVQGNLIGYEKVDLQIAHATRNKKLLTAGTISMGVGGAGVIAGIVLQILAGRTAQNDAEQADDYDEYKSLDDERKSYQVGAVVCFAVGAAAIGAGVAMILVAKKGEREQGSDIKISLVPGLGSVTVVGRF